MAEAANTVYAGPTGGSPAEPTFRELVYADFNAALRAAILADINCEQAGQTSQWLEFALSSNGSSAAIITTTGLKFVDRPPAFEFVDETNNIRLSCIAPPTTDPLIIDVKFGSTAGVGGTSIFSTKIRIDAGERTSTSASTPYVLSTTTHVNDEEMSVLIDSMGTGITGLLIRMHVRWL